MNVSTIATQLHAIYAAISAAEAKYQRPSSSVELIAISKTRTIAEIQAAVAAGQLAFGESYVQEALPKIAALAALQQNRQGSDVGATAATTEHHSTIAWHYVGLIQSNKIKQLAQNFHWVQSVTRREQAEKLNQYRPSTLPPLQICLEINLSAERSKAGIELELAAVTALACAVMELPRLQLRGLMAIPAPAPTFAAQLAAFEKLAQIYLQLKEGADLPLDTLSIGMSDDYVAAIAAGATMVRIGTAIFGARQ